MMSSNEIAELLVSIWKLGAEDERFPTNEGVIARALKSCLGDFPDRFSTALTFSLTSVGLRCHEMPNVLLAAVDLLLIEDFGQFGSILIDQTAARQIAVAYGLSTSVAMRLGKRLKTAVFNDIQLHTD